MMKIYQKIEKFSLRIIEKLENQKITFINWLIIFFAIDALNLLLRNFSTGRLDLFFFQYRVLFFFSPCYYLFCILSVILILYLLTKEKIEKISKIALFGLPIILLPPIIDLIVSGGQGGIPTEFSDPFFDYRDKGILVVVQKYLEIILYGFQGLLYFGQLPSYAKPEALLVNYGSKIQMGLIALGIIWYIFFKTKNVFKAFLGFLLFRYPQALTIPSINYTFSKFSTLNPSFRSYFIGFTWYLIGICFLAFFWFYIYNKEKCLALLKNLRITRIFNNIVILGLGLYLGGVLKYDLNFSNITSIILAIISILFYWLSVTGFDDLSDEEIDRISNPSRPLPAGKFGKEEFRNLSKFFLLTSYYTAFAVGFNFFLFILLRSLVGYLYFAPPFRLKRFPILATFCQALAFLFTVYAGFLLISENTIFDFPGKLAIFILIAFTLGITFKDIKDYEGDKSAGVYTIPVIFGLEKGKKIIGALVFTVFILCPLLFFNHFKNLILPALLAGILSFWLITGKRFEKNRDWFLFLIYSSYGLFFILTVF